VLQLLSPVHATKVEFGPAVAVSFTCVPVGKFALQVFPQLMPEGLLVTVPVPFPERPTVNTVALNVAVTFSLALSVTAHVGLLPQLPPVHPANDELASAVAASVTVPAPKLALQVCPQLIPDGELVTVPVPVPARATVSTGEVLKLAITEVFCVKVTLQAAVPLQPPDHPAKKEFAAGDAVRVTVVPLEKLALQAWPQLIPAGLLLTVPPPPPVACTVS
jgi:hypothetical protein